MPLVLVVMIACWHPFLAAKMRPMDAPATVAALLDLANAGPPTAAEIETAMAGWTLSGVTRTDLHDDERGWGAYITLRPTALPLTALASVLGPTRSVPRNPDDFRSGDKVSAYISRGGKTVRVFVELVKGDRTQVQSITMHFQK